MKKIEGRLNLGIGGVRVLVLVLVHPLFGNIASSSPSDTNLSLHLAQHNRIILVTILSSKQLEVEGVTQTRPLLDEARDYSKVAIRRMRSILRTKKLFSMPIKPIKVLFCEDQ